MASMSVRGGGSPNSSDVGLTLRYTAMPLTRIGQASAGMTSAAASTVSRRTVGDVITCGSYNVAQMKVSRVWHEPMQWLETRLSARVKRELRAEQKNALRQVEEAQSDLRSLVKEMRTERKSVV